jgi:hypothetical protein
METIKFKFPYEGLETRGVVLAMWLAGDGELKHGLEEFEVASYDDCLIEVARRRQEDVVIRDKSYPSYTNSGEWLVLTNSERDKRIDDEMENFIDEFILSEMPESSRFYFDRDRWKEDVADDEWLDRGEGYGETQPDETEMMRFLNDSARNKVKADGEDWDEEGYTDLTPERLADVVDDAASLENFYTIYKQ